MRRRSVITAASLAAAVPFLPRPTLAQEARIVGGGAVSPRQAYEKWAQLAQGALGTGGPTAVAEDELDGQPAQEHVDEPVAHHACPDEVVDEVAVLDLVVEVVALVGHLHIMAARWKSGPQTRISLNHDSST